MIFTSAIVVVLQKVVVDHKLVRKSVVGVQRFNSSITYIYMDDELESSILTNNDKAPGKHEVDLHPL